MEAAWLESRGARTRDSVLGPLPSGLLLTACLPSKVLGPTLLFKFLLSLSKSETSLNFIFLIYKVKEIGSRDKLGQVQGQRTWPP